MEAVSAHIVAAVTCVTSEITHMHIVTINSVVMMSHTASAISHTEVATACAVDETSHVQHFEPRVIFHEKAKPFHITN